MDEGIQQLIEWIEQLAPEVWRIALRQVYAGAIADVVMIVFCVIIGIVGLGQIRKRWDEWDSVDHNIVTFFSTLVGILLLMVFIGMVIDLVLALVNPEWRALRLIMGLGD